MKSLKERKNFIIILLLIIIITLIYMNSKIKSELDNLSGITMFQFGTLINSLDRFNLEVSDYIEESDYTEKELYGYSKMCISAGIETKKLLLPTLSKNYEYLGEKLEKLSYIYESGSQEDKSNLIDEIKHFINTNEGIYDLINNKSKSIYDIKMKDLYKGELRKLINDYSLKQQSEFYGNAN